MITSETWVQITGTQNLYSINRDCEIRRNGKCNILTPLLSKKSYPAIKIVRYGRLRRIYIHRLVAEFFIPNPYNKKYVNHKDGDKNNYAISNLEWSTSSENTIHYYKYLKGHNSDELLYKICEYAIPMTLIGDAIQNKRRYELREMIKRYAAKYNTI